LLTEKGTGKESDRLEQWFDFTQRLYSTLDLEDASKIALDVALRFTGFQRGMLFTNEKNSFRFRCAQNSAGRTLRSEQLPSVGSLIEEVSKTLVPAHRNVQTDSAKTALCIPLVSNHESESKVIAAIYLDSVESKPYAYQEKEVVQMFLLHAGPALETVILYDQATKDSLTGVYLRHYFDACSQIEWRRMLRHKRCAAVLKIDIDRLREINEEYSRAEGDVVLQKTAQLLREICRTEDLIARYDVDEFAVLLPETDTSGARLVASRIWEEVPLLLTRDPEKPVTVSIGGASFPRCSVNSMQDLMKLADIALFQSKQSGGRRPVIYEPSLTSAHKKVF
jgi:diguanylate cyclase (GGDEF)-like protein